MALLKSQVLALMLFGHFFKDESKGKLIEHIHLDPEFDTFWLLKLCSTQFLCRIWCI